MASSRRTYDTDVITLRTVFAKNPGNSNVPALRTLTADGQGGTYWAVPSTLGVNPAFNQIITSGGTYTADLSYNTFRLTAAENIGMTDGPPGSNQTYLFAKAFSQFDVSGENSVYAFANNQLDSSVTLAGQGGITLRADPATNTLFFVGPASNTYVVSTGIYGFNQIKVVDAASSITSSIQTWQGNYLTATSPSTLLNFIGYNDIQMSTNVTTNSIFFTISTFTSKGYLDISANAYGAYPSTLSTVSSLYVQQSLFNSTVAYLSSYTGFGFSSVVSSINALAISTGDQFYILTGLINAAATLVQLNNYSNAITNEMFSTTAGLGTLGYISTGGGGTIGSLQLISTVAGLGSAGYLSTGGGGGGDVTTAKLISTVEGLGSAGYISSLSTITTSSIFNTGAISTYSLEVFGPATLTNSGSTILRGPIYLGGPTFVAGTFTGLANTIVTPGNLNSTVQGLGTARYISSTQLLSTVRGLGSIGYLSSLQGFALSTGSLTASSLNLLDPYTNDVNYLTVSSGSLLVNGAKVGSNGGGGSGGVAQIVAGTGISLSPPAGTGVVTITNTGASITYVDTAISSFSTALGPVTGGGGGSYNFSTVSSVYGSAFVTNLLIASTMTTANILPSQSNLWVALGYGTSATNSIQTSLDGLTWTDIASGGFSDSGKAVAYNGSFWVAVGNDTNPGGNIQYSGDGKNWSNSVSGAFFAGANGVAWNGTIWVAVGNDAGSASIKYSRNGINWSNSSSGGFSVAGESVAWNGSYWVAAGLSATGVDSLQYSLDGSNWVSASSGGFSSGAKGIAWNGLYWVATGTATGTASIQYSGDGRNWSNSVTGGFFSSGWRVAWNGKLWVAVGDDINPLKSIQTSIDGSNWSDIQTGGFAAGNDGYGIAWNGYFWVAAGIGGTATNSLQRSFDGINWTTITSGGFASGALGVGFSSNLSPGYKQQNLTILSQNIPLFLNSTNQIMAQPSSLVLNNLLIDTQWKRVGINCNTPGFDLDVNGIGHFLTLSSLRLNISSLNGANYPTIFPSTVAGLGTVGYVSTTGLISTVAGLGTVGYTSTLSNVNVVSSLAVNASSITASLVSSLAVNVSTINGIPFGLPGYPSTVSTNYALAFNTSSMTMSSMNFVNLAQTNTNLWVVVGSGGSAASNIKYSTDGSNWSNSSSGGFTTQGYNVAWNGRLWVAVGQGGGTIKYSTDGLIWTNASSGTFSSVGYGVAWNGRLWVATGNRNTTDADTIKYSTDGINWTNSASGGFSGAGLNIAWNGKIWLALGGNGGASGSIKYSTDGINWINNSTGGFSSVGRGIAWNGRIWVASGNNGGAAGSIQYSTDGSNWSNSANGGFTTTGWDIAWNGRMFVAVGSDSTTANTIQYSYDGINWSNSASGGFLSPGGVGVGVAWNGRLWVISGGNNPTDTNSIKYSTDGINWTNASGGFTTVGYGIAYSSNVIPSYNQTNFEIGPQNIPVFLRSTNTMSFLASTIITNDTLFVDTTNRVGINTGTPQTDLDVGGIGRFFTASTLAFNLSSINGANFATILPSTVSGLGTAGYVSTASLVSTVGGLGTTWFNSTIAGLGTVGYVSTSGLISTVAGLGQNYVSTASLVSTVGGLGTTWFNSTIAGLGTVGYVSTSALTSSLTGLGTIGFLSTLSNVSLVSTQQINASSIRAPILSTSLLNTSSLTSVFLSSLAVNASSITAPILSSLALNLSSINGANFATILPSTATGLGSLGYVSTTSLTSTVRGLGSVGYVSTLSTVNVVSSLAMNASSITAINLNTSSLFASSITNINLSQTNTNLWVATGFDTGNTTGRIKYSYDGSNWSSSSSGAFGSWGRGVNWNGRTWVAVGYNNNVVLGTIRYSTDGINWLANSTGGFNNQGYGVAWNGRTWVAVGYNNNSATGTIQYSADGINWLSNASGGFSSTGYGVAWNSKLWVAVGNSSPSPGTIQYSSDGINWSSAISGGFINGASPIGYGVGWNGRTWVAVGSNGGAPGSIQYSTDGSNWLSNASGGFLVQGKGIAWNGRFWVAVGNNNNNATGSIQYSTDGINWLSNASGGFSTEGNAISWNGSLWIAVGQGATAAATIQYSRDGINWTNSSSGGFLDLIGGGVAYSSNVIPSYNQTNFEIESQNIPNYLTSTNQLSFLPSTIIANNTLFIDTTNRVGINTGIPQYDLDVNGVSRLSSITNINLAQSRTNLWVAVGTDTSRSGIQYSGDGSNWTASAGVAFSGGVYGIAWSGSMWVALGNDATQNIKYSYDGINWTNAAGAKLFSSYGLGAAWNGRIWIAVGQDATTTNTIRYSTDGINWSAIPSGGFTTNGYAVAWNGSMWVAVGTDSTPANTIKYSYDGVTWLNSSSGGFATRGLNIAWNGRLWVAVGTNGGTFGSIKYSTDGINWTNNATGGFGVDATGIAWNGRMWVATGYNAASGSQSLGTIQYSLDGINWTNANNGFATQAFNVAWNGNYWAATGQISTSISTTIQLSTDGINWINNTSGGNAIVTRNIAYSSNVVPSYNQTNFEIEPQNIPVFLRSTNTFSFLASTIITNNTLYVDRLNRVGINTGAPQNDLDVNGSIRASSIGINALADNTFRINLNGLIQATGGAIYLTSTATNSHNAVLQWNQGGYAQLGSYARDARPLVRPNLAIAGINNVNAVTLAFFNNASSFVGIGSNYITPNYTLDVNGSSRISSLIVGTPTTNPSTTAFLLSLTSDSATKPFTTAWTAASDQRVKENITDADFDRCYSDVKALKLRRFTWASSFYTEYDGYDKRVLGFIAQEVSSIVPKAVTIKEANGFSNFQFLNVDQLNMSLYGAVKKTIIDKECMESTIKGQQVTIETLLGSQTSILSTLNGLQGR